MSPIDAATLGALSWAAMLQLLAGLTKLLATADTDQDSVEDKYEQQILDLDMKSDEIGQKIDQKRQVTSELPSVERQKLYDELLQLQQDRGFAEGRKAGLESQRRQESLGPAMLNLLRSWPARILLPSVAERRARVLLIRQISLVPLLVIVLVRFAVGEPILGRILS